MREILKSLAKKVTLELIYEAIDERTAEIKERIDRLEDKVNHLEEKMESRFSSLNSRIDQLFTAILNLSEKNNRQQK